MKKLSIAAIATLALAFPALAQTPGMPAPTNTASAPHVGQKYEEHFEERQKLEQEMFQKRQAIEQKYFQKRQELLQQEHAEMEELRAEMMRNHPGMAEHMGAGQGGQGSMSGGPGMMNGQPPMHPGNTPSTPTK